MDVWVTIIIKDEYYNILLVQAREHDEQWLPLVSIIIPTYNSSDYITETLTKLEKQTYPNFEIVIVNDGSKDNTSSVLREYGLTHSRLIIINKENGGVSSARNTGIRKAQGQFICFMDDDDEIDPNYLLKMYSRQHETGGDAIYCGLYGHHIKMVLLTHL